MATSASLTKRGFKLKRILIDRSKNFYVANLHCHSTKSDGNMTVEQIKEHYKSNGYSIVAFTDHEHLIDNSYLNDDSFLALTACELAIKELPKVSTLKNTRMKVCHLNFFAKEAGNVDTPCYNSVYDHFVNDEIKDQIVHSCGEYERVYSHEGISEMIRMGNENGFLVAYNHPRWSLENATDYLGYEGLWAVEIYNNECYMSGLYEYDINVYDDFLRAGKDMACIATDDNHSVKYACGGKTVINADSLDYASVIKAMEEHRLYATTGPLIHELYIEDGVISLTFEGGEYATMSTAGRRVRRKDAYCEGENTVKFHLGESDGYVRFDVVDKQGRRANTCAYFV